jgi:hypothetical protein
MSGGDRVFAHDSDFDHNGLVYYLGTNDDQEAWENPVERGLVKVTSSSIGARSVDHSAVVGRFARLSLCSIRGDAPSSLTHIIHTHPFSIPLSLSLSLSLHRFPGREPVRCLTADKPNSWICVE